MSPEELAEQRMLEHLQQRISDPGGHIYGQKLTHAEYLDFVRQYDALKARIDTREAERARIALEGARVETDRARALAEREVEHRRLDIEEERVRVEKAQVLLRAIEIAAEKGADVNHLLAAAAGLGQHLLPGVELQPQSAPALVDKKTE